MFERLGRLLGASVWARTFIVLITSTLFALAHYSVQGLAGKEQDVHDDGPEQSQAERNEARADEQANPAENVEDGDRIIVAAADERHHESGGLFRHGLLRNEVEKGVGTEDDEDKPEQDSRDD